MQEVWKSIEGYEGKYEISSAEMLYTLPKTADCVTKQERKTYVW